MHIQLADYIIEVVLTFYFLTSQFLQTMKCLYFQSKGGL